MQPAVVKKGGVPLAYPQADMFPEHAIQSQSERDHDQAGVQCLAGQLPRRFGHQGFFKGRPQA